MAPVAVLLEEGRRKTFACALDWPGWSRSAATRDDALEALDAYRERYTDVLTVAGLACPRGALRVTATIAGSASTDFGAPGAIVEADRRALRAADRARNAAVLRACWAALDALKPRELRRGPRGGGRDFEKIRRHVTDAEVAYARGVGLRASDTKGDEALVAALRARLVDVLLGAAPPDRDGKWPLRYATRRIAWHVLDHAFEIEDRTLA